MKIIFHADDFGNSKSITDNILDCFSGALTSTSIIPNGHAFDYAICEYSKLHKKGKRLAIHINLSEGYPISLPNDVSMLVNKKGMFYHSFFSLFMTYYFSNKKTRKKLGEQIKTEVSAQLAKVNNNLSPKAPLSIDSHLHLHILPFIFRLIVELKDKYDIKYIRIPREKYVHDNGILFGMPINILKFLLINYLSNKCIPYLFETSIQYSNYFIGVLRTGKMNATFILKSLSSIIKDSEDVTVEVLLHPGGAEANESYLWEDYPNLQSYYLSDLRTYEKNCLINGELELFNNKQNSI